MNMSGKGDGTRLSEEEIDRRMEKAWKERRVNDFLGKFLISDIVPIVLLLGMIGFILLMSEVP